MPIVKNPDLAVTNQVPGVYIFQARTGGAPVPDNRRVLIVGYRTSAGNPGKVSTPQRVNSEQDVVDLAGKGSDCVRMYRAMISHLGGASGGADIWVCTLNAPSGTAQTRLIKVMAAPSGAALGSNSTASAAGVMSVWIEGYRADVTIASGDTFATIATNLLTELLKIEDFVGFTFTRSTDTITCTARHAALTSADSPIIVTFSNTSMAVAASPGTLTYANAAGADGTSILYCATQSVSTAITNGDSANTIAANTITAINAANAFPLSAAQTAPAAVVTLFYRDDRVCNWLATAITPAATITTTLAAAVGNHAAGLPSSSSPTLATTLTNIAAQPGYMLWLTNLNGAGSFITDAAYTQIGSTTDYSILGALCTHIEQQGNGTNQKGQKLHFGETRALATAGAVPVGTTPNLTTSQRFSVDWVAGGGQQACEYAARCVADVLKTTSVHWALPYHGHILKTDSKVPLLTQHTAVRPSDSDVNAAIASYFMTPIRDDGQGQLIIVSGRTTAKPSASMSGDYRWWSVAILDDYCRDDMALYMAPFLKDKSIKAIGQPVTPYTITAEAVRAQVLARIAFYNANDYFDGGAGDFKDLCKAEINVQLPSRIDVKQPKKYPIPFEQLSIVSEFAS